MKRIIILSVSWMTFFGCSNQSSDGQKKDTIPGSKKVIDKKFFSYDQILYYHSDQSEREIEKLFDKKITALDSFKIGIVIGDIPKDISDLEFIDKLNEIGYSKDTIDKVRFKDIDNIFVEKDPGNKLSAACMNVYRDILIFKKENKIIGTAKICFGCMAYQIKGTQANIDNFGQDDDYVQLKKILYK